MRNRRTTRRAARSLRPRTTPYARCGGSAPARARERPGWEGSARPASTPRCAAKGSGRPRPPLRVGLLGRRGAERVLQAQRDPHQPVHGEQMRDDPGHGRTPAHGPVALEPAQPHRRVPLRVAYVLQQRVEPRGLRVVGRRPLGHRDTRRTPVQAALQDPGAQRRVEIEALRRCSSPTAPRSLSASSAHEPHSPRCSSTAAVSCAEQAASAHAPSSDFSTRCSRTSGAGSGSGSPVSSTEERGRGCAAAAPTLRVPRDR